MAAGLRLRSEPGTDADSVATLPAGATVAMIGGPQAAQGMEWYQVRFLDRTGWLAAGEDRSWLRRVTNGRIAFSCPNCGDDANPATMTANPDGTEPAPLYPRGGRTTWNPDGSLAAVETSSPVGPTQLAIVRADGGTVDEIAAGGAAWSPDGQRLAYVDYDARALVLVDGEEEPIALTVTDLGVPGSLAWSPDGMRMAFIAIDCPECPPDGPIVGEPPMSVFVFEPPGGAVIKVADGGYGGQLRWLPDGSGLTYVEYDFGTGALEMRRVNLESGSVTVLAEGDDILHGHAFSPDGSLVAAGTTNGIVVFAADGSDPRTLVPARQGTNPMPMEPRWSPDGRWILYDRVWVTGDAIETWVIPVDGGEATRVAELGSEASWQPILEDLP